MCPCAEGVWRRVSSFKQLPLGDLGYFLLSSILKCVDCLLEHVLTDFAIRKKS